MQGSNRPVELVTLAKTEHNMPNLQEMTQEQLVARVRELESAQRNTGIGIKVADKGGVSVYGIGRFPVTLYRSQWETLFGKVDAIKAFIAEHVEELAVKPEKAAK